MKRIVYADCKECEGKGWYYGGGDEPVQEHCADCAFKNGVEAMLLACLELFPVIKMYTRSEIMLILATVYPASLDQPPICMCEDTRLQMYGHDDDCHLNETMVTT